MNVLISGYYGYGNAGDEAVLEAIVNGLRGRDPLIGINILSATPAQTAKHFKVQSISRFSFPEIIWKLLRSDVFISGGGTLFQDATSTRSLFYYSGLVVLAKLFGKKTAIFSQGFGPLTGRINRRIALFAFGQADLITVRDEVSFEALLLSGIDKNKVFLTADPAFLLPVLSGGRELLEQVGIPREKALLGISLRNFKQSPEKEDAFWDALAGAIDRFSIAHDYLPVFVPFQLSEDREAITKVRRKMTTESKVINRLFDQAQLLSIFSEFNFFVGMRLHALIFATMNRVPSAGISYDPKVSAFTRAMGMPQISFGEKAQDFIEDAFACREQIKSNLIEKVEKCKLQANTNFNLFFDNFITKEKR